jgi:hypothetical protein
MLRIKMYMHCAKCLREIPEGQSPGDYARLHVGWTDTGLQVWCSRHDSEVFTLDGTVVEEVATRAKAGDKGGSFLVGERDGDIKVLKTH